MRTSHVLRLAALVFVAACTDSSTPTLQIDDAVPEVPESGGTGTNDISIERPVALFLETDSSWTLHVNRRSTGRRVLTAVAWNSANPAIASIHAQTGVVTGVAEGRVYVRAVSTLGFDSVAIDVVTNRPLSVSPAAPTVQLGETMQLASNSTTATTWSSNTPAVASVSTDGMVTGVGIGAATITARNIGNGTGSVTVTVSAPPASPVPEPTLFTLTIAPPSVSLTTGLTQQFAVAGTWSDGSAATPAVRYTATGGAITASGLYTAGTTPGAYRVIATQHDGTRADTSTVTITEPIATLLSVLLLPASVTLAPGTTQQFTVSGRWNNGGTTVPAVSYSATGGTITSAGLYTAGNTAGTYRVVAVQQGGGKADTAVVTILPPVPTLLSVSMTPATATVTAGATQQFAVAGRWSDGSAATPAVSYAATGGTIAASGLYTAGTTPGAYRVIATQQDGTRADTSTVTIAAPIATLLSVHLLPASATLASGTTQQFTVSGTWSNGATTAPPVSYSATGGTITPAGLYTAGNTGGTYRVIAVQQDGSRADTSVVTTLPVAPTLLGVVLTPGTATVTTGATQQFAVAGRWSDGSTVTPAITYSATGGTISASGLYAAGEAAGTFRVVAKQIGGSAADTSTVIVAAQTFPHVAFGVHMDITWYSYRAYRQTLIQRAKNIGSTVSRNSLLWHLVEPVRGAPNWSVLDETVDDLTAQGIEPLMAVYGSPSWATGAPTAGDPYYYLQVPTDSVAFLAWVASYKQFIGDAARRYRGKVRLWELGNEQNWEHFWRPAPNVAQYAYWYSELRQAIKAEIPDAVVAVGGLTLLTASPNRIGPNINGVAFMQQLYARNVFPDAVAVHPYTDVGVGPDTHVSGGQSFDDIDAVRSVMTSRGEGARPMWVTEWGWSTTDVSPAVQSTYVRRSLELLATRYSSFVTVATYFALADFPQWKEGLYSEQGVIKPAGNAFQQFMSSYRSQP